MFGIDVLFTDGKVAKQIILEHFRKLLENTIGDDEIVSINLSDTHIYYNAGKPDTENEVNAVFIVRKGFAEDFIWDLKSFTFGFEMTIMGEEKEYKGEELSEKREVFSTTDFNELLDFLNKHGSDL